MLFRASEVCEIADVQPYVLRSWEAEFTDLGVTRAPGGARLYRKADVERVLRIKQLVFVEGLTLAGARRRLGEEQPTVDAEEEVRIDQLLSRDARERLASIKDGLRSILAVLDANGRPVPVVQGGRKAASAPSQQRKRARGGKAKRPRAQKRRSRRRRASP